MLQNAYLVAKIGADTAENERNLVEICQKLATTLPLPGQFPGAVALGEKAAAVPAAAKWLTNECAG